MNYLFTSAKLDGKMLFKYHSNGMLAGFEVEGYPTSEQLRWIMRNMPVHESMIGELQRLTRGVIEKVLPDLSFDHFWDTYRYKVGNKRRAEKLWDALSEADRAKAITSIISYDNFLARRPNQEKAYPETYLAQRRFDNTFSR
jgi:hypothetical protein